MGLREKRKGKDKMNREQQVRKIAKTLVKEFKADKDAKEIRIKDAFRMVGTNSGSGCYFRYDDPKFNFNFGALDDEGVARLTWEVANAIDAILKLPKKTAVFKDRRETTRWRGWSSYTLNWVEKYVIVTPCKEFGAVNKKLVKLGLKPISFVEWYHGGVSGKRANYWMDEKNYYAEDAKVCKAVLDYLKGKKRLAYEIVRDEEFEDRDYGIRHETEWYGHLALRIQFTDARGKKATF